MKKIFLLIFICMFLFIVSASAEEQDFSFLLETKLSTLTPGNTKLSEQNLDRLKQFYRSRNYQPVWIKNEEKINSKAKEMLNFFEQASNEGLVPEDYWIQSIKEKIDNDTPDDLVNAEWMLSRGSYYYINDLYAGRIDPIHAHKQYLLIKESLSLEEILNNLADDSDPEDVIEKYHNANSNYEQLKKFLSFYRDIKQKGEWISIPIENKKINVGDHHPILPLIRQRLTQEQFPISDIDSDLYDSELESIVKSFQKNHGLTDDGVIGKNTILEMNIPVQQKIQQILISIERERWLPSNLGVRYIAVNIADYTLKFIDNDQVILNSKVIVGTNYNRTPTFSKNMKYLVVNPYWDVPRSILVKEILPQFSNNPDYLSENNFEIVDGAETIEPYDMDWSNITEEDFPYNIRQRPGQSNALGQIKFIFPNEFNIYLHDTPAKQLFQKTVRNFSHGCIRVEKPLELAEAVLNDPDWSQEKINQIIATGKETLINLKEELPVYIMYITAWVDNTKIMQFRPDIYNRDTELNQIWEQITQERAIPKNLS
ncbi:MAG: L,D-transpeptidase family protein [Alphaproteobacteria bacterium]|nr:L,D-transpeptidase family protein [Alphaproteobacteria bacterium]